MKTINFSTKINRKTGKEQYTQNFYVDQHGQYQLGKLPPLTHHYADPKTKTTTTVKVCKFCWNLLPEMREKGHDMIFCNKRCQNLKGKIDDTLQEKKKKEPDIIAIMWQPEKIESEYWAKDGTFYPPKFKFPEKINMKIIREGKPEPEDWEPLSTRKRTPKKDV